MNIFKIITLACCLLLSAAIYAQDKATVKGNIKDAKTGEPLYGVNVYTNTNQGTTTDFDGDFTLKLDPGTYDLKISFVSYRDIKKSITLTSGQVLEVVEKLESQTIELGTTVVSASKYEKKLSEETVSMDVLGAQLIKNSNALQAEDAMEKVPGVTIVDGQANIRGGSGWSYGAGSRVAVLLDDLPFMSSDAADAKWSAMAIEHVEQVEVIKGAASALYGSSALNGIINLRTAWPKNEPVTKIVMTTGVSQNPKYESLIDSFTYSDWIYNNPANPTDSIQQSNTIPVGEGMWYGRDLPKNAAFQISHRRKIKSFDLILGGSYNSSTSHLLGGGSTEFRVSGKLRYRPKNVRGLSTGVNYGVTNAVGSTFFLWNGLDSMAYTPFPGTVSEYYTLRVYVDPYLVYFDKKDNQYSFKGRYFNSKNTNNTGQGSVPQMFMGEFQYQRMFVPIKLNIVAGVFGYYSWINPPKGASGSLFGSATANNGAAYFQADKKFFDKLSVAAGVRYEVFRVETYKGNSKPLFRFGLNYQAAEATYIRASWGQGYRFPTIAEKFINTNVGIIGIFPNPNIEPEKGWSAELGIKQGVKMGEWMGYADISAFVNQYDNMMEFTFGPFGNPPSLFDPVRHNPNEPADPLFGLGFSSQNVGETRILGTEFTLMGTGKLGGKVPMTILAGYTFIDPRNLNWDDPIDLYDRYGNKVNDQTVVDTTSFFNEFIARTYSETSSSSKNILKYRNRHTLKADIEWVFLKEKVGIGFSVQYTSFMENIDQIFIGKFVTFENEGVLGNTNVFSALKTFREKNERGNTLFDARISYRFTPKAKLTFICKNIINQQIMERPGYLSGPRNYNLQFDIEF
jgi:iron complex outermembrane receptor protein